MEFVGQPHAARFLETAWRTGRLAHAYAFVGPPGIGKREAALTFAAGLICPDENLDCADPTIARRVRQLLHPDVRVYGPEPGKRMVSTATMEQVVDDLQLRPMEAKRRVAIVDRADTMNEASANRFLKTLEEPPDDATLVLLVDSWFRLLETVRSRVQAVRFMLLPPDELALRLPAGDDSPDAAAIQELVPLAGGSPGQLQSLLEDGFPEVRRFLRAAVLERPEADPVGAMEQLQELTRLKSDPTQEPQRRRMRTALGQVATWWRDALVARLHAAEPVDAAAAPQAIRRAEPVSPGRLIAHVDRLLDMTDDLELNLNTRLWTARFMDLAPFPDRH